MLRTTCSRARAIVRPVACSAAAYRPEKTTSNCNPDDLRSSSLASLTSTTFSPINPGVTVTRPLPLPYKAQQKSQTPTPNLEALIAASTSYSPVNPGATLPLLTSGVSIPNPSTTVPPSNGQLNKSHQIFNLGSRSRVLEDIPSILKRFDVPKANVLTRFPDKAAAKTPPPLSKNPDIQQKQKQKDQKTEIGPRMQKKQMTTSTSSPALPLQRPWLFKLPPFLRPREGTTHFANFAALGEGDMEAKGKSNILQYILYGDPDPDHSTVAGVGADAGAGVDVQGDPQRSVWRSFLYGVPEMKGEKVGMAEVKTETVGDAREDVSEEKVEEVVVEQGMENVGKVEVLEGYEGYGNGTVAK